jgi:hypothetical protein
LPRFDCRSDFNSAKRQAQEVPLLEDLGRCRFGRKKPRAPVWKLDRLGRSLRDLIDIVNRLEQSCVSFICLARSIDSRTPKANFSFASSARSPSRNEN